MFPAGGLTTGESKWRLSGHGNTFSLETGNLAIQGESTAVLKTCCMSSLSRLRLERSVMTWPGAFDGVSDGFPHGGCGLRIEARKQHVTVCLSSCPLHHPRE